MTDLQTLFALDPLTYTKEGEEVKKIVARLRDSRGQYNLAAQTAPKKAATPRSASAKAAATLAPGLKINLTSLLNKGGQPIVKGPPQPTPDRGEAPAEVEPTSAPQGGEVK